LGLTSLPDSNERDDKIENKKKEKGVSLN
jgi:hypothetical protein